MLDKCMKQTLTLQKRVETTHTLDPLIYSVSKKIEGPQTTRDSVKLSLVPIEGATFAFWTFTNLDAKELAQKKLATPKWNATIA